jgi:fluoride exporter
LESYLLIGLGSALGGAGRFWCSGLVARRFGETFPWGTLIVNIVGSFIIGFVNGLTTSGARGITHSPARDFLMAGMCGGYTTFSAFSLQTLNLLQEGRSLHAATYVSGSVLACLLAVWLGHLAAVALGHMVWR